jgi:sugar/nucleoside kinase (ribokinase family)
MVITRGPNGAFLYDGEETYHVLAPKVEAVDANGAGDLFAGSFIYGITNGMSFADAGRLATHAASTLVTKFGPRLKREETQAIKKKFS